MSQVVFWARIRVNFVVMPGALNLLQSRISIGEGS